MLDRIRVGLIDFDPEVRSGRRLIIESDPRFEIVLECSGSLSDIELVTDALIDVLVIDQRLDTWTGLDFVRQLNNSAGDFGNFPVVILTTSFLQDLLRIEALAVGCYDVVSLEAGPDALIVAISEGISDHPALSAKELARLIAACQIPQFPDFEFSQAIESLSQELRAQIDLLRKSWSSVLEGSDFDWSTLDLSSVLEVVKLRSLPELVIRMYRAGILDERSA